jgi:hypothetical protein
MKPCFEPAMFEACVCLCVHRLLDLQAKQPRTRRAGEKHFFPSRTAISERRGFLVFATVCPSLPPSSLRLYHRQRDISHSNNDDDDHIVCYASLFFFEPKMHGGLRRQGSGRLNHLPTYLLTRQRCKINPATAWDGMAPRYRLIFTGHGIEGSTGSGVIWFCGPGWSISAYAFGNGGKGSGKR